MKMSDMDFLHTEYGVIHRPFGPIIYQQEISDELFTELKEKIGQSEEDYRKNLAGNIKDERSLNDMLSEDAIIEIRERCALYTAAYYGKPPQYHSHYMNTVQLETIWVNFMKAYEWNPPHQHTGDMSFVIYIDNPVNETIEAQHETQRHSNAPTAGKIMFRYGEQHNLSHNRFHARPNAKDMLIFPAWLEHQVFQFTQKDITRISVAGNALYKYNETTANEDE